MKTQNAQPKPRAPAQLSAACARNSSGSQPSSSRRRPGPALSHPEFFGF